MKKNWVILLGCFLSAVVFSEDLKDEKQIYSNELDGINRRESNIYLQEEEVPKNYINQNIRLNSDAQDGLVRLTLGEGYMHFNERVWMTYRLRKFNDTNGDKNPAFEGSDLRFRLYYGVGKIGEGIEAHHRFEYRSITDSYDRVKWNYEINFAERLGMKEPGEYFVVRPLLGWASNKIDSKGNDYDSVITGLEGLVSFKVWREWYFQFNAYGQYHFNFGDEYEERYGVDNVAVLSLEAYLLNETKIFDLGKDTSLNFYFEGGFDPANFYEKKHEFTTSEGRESFEQQYSLYAMPELNIKHKLESGFTLKGAIGMESRNQRGNDEISDYNNQVYFSIGWETRY